MVCERLNTPELRAFVGFLAQEKGQSKGGMARRYGISRSSVYRICKENLSAIRVRSNVRARIGRPRLLAERYARNLLRQVKLLRKQQGNFSVARLMTQCGISTEKVSVTTVRRVLHRNGYHYLQARRKGIFTDRNRRKRLTFVKRIRREFKDTVWTKEIAFYLDGVSFAHKFHPSNQARAVSGRIWQRRDEGMAPGCTAKRSCVGSGGRLVAISYNEGII